MSELERKVKLLREVQRMIEEAQAEAESLKDEIKAIMGETEEARAGEYKITWKPVTSVKLDVTAFRKAMPEIAARFSKEATVRRFCIS